MTWWGWVIAGAILLGAELLFVSAQFYLVFVGSAAILTGLAALAAPLTDTVQWALFAVLAVVSMLFFRSRIYQRFHHELPEVATGLTGEALTLAAALGAGEGCQTEVAGTFWTVRNDTAAVIPAGTRVRVVRVKDLTLFVRPDA
jgi:inner membrane protein